MTIIGLCGLLLLMSGFDNGGLLCYYRSVFVVKHLEFICEIDVADIAQLVEHLTCNENVLRSIRGIGSRSKKNGGVPEWSKGSDCKSDGSAFGGSNPPPTTIQRFCRRSQVEDGVAYCMYVCRRSGRQAMF